ncbi:hypothetical protein SH528x_002144 [Novipirellula sp. SH528]|uniref:hypothetical protein n=1 Tax=Novipirellula sp. SH528 TaxID=3454466 RepID=UPI003F9FBE49
MTADEFVDSLAALCPTEAELQSHGLNENDIQDIKSAFMCVPRRDPSEALRTANPVFDLLNRYDCTSVQLPNFRFSDCPQQTANGVLIGWWEADPVLLDSGSIACYDHAAPDYVISTCAKDCSRFLAALIHHAARYRSPEWRERRDELGRECASVAGDPSSWQFYV